ncbi:MAG: PD-(D/E)XK nuclease family protein [Elusimicrobiales bacterium]|nr:PD-(D/E)XK nuclease family protein [Elusimicrobiales bacterium]
MFEINYSKINAYNFCHYLYKFIYIDGNYIKHNWKTSLGVSIHKCLVNYANKKLELKGILESFEENWNNAGFNTPQQMMECYEVGIELIKNFYEFEKKNPSSIFSVDDFFEIFLDDEIVLKGTVDRIDILDDDSLEIIDYKLAMEEKNHFHHRNELQLMIYAFGISKKYFKKVSYISYYYISGPKKQRMEYIEDSSLITNLKDIAFKMKRMEFYKKGKCDICLAKESCKYREVKNGNI